MGGQGRSHMPVNGSGIPDRRETRVFPAVSESRRNHAFHSCSSPAVFMQARPKKEQEDAFLFLFCGLIVPY